MFQSQDAIEQLAGRIERAYRRRHPRWQSVSLTPGVWESAAARLCEVSEDVPATPIDPELFVAVQPGNGCRRDPWVELTERRSQRRYLKAVRKIVSQLREELKDEVRLAERRMLRGVTLDQILLTHESRISPLTRYILAHRAGRVDLSTKYRPAAEVQDRACPLYRLASQSLLPDSAYPTPDERDALDVGGNLANAFSLN